MGNSDGTLCISADHTQSHFGLPVTMETCDSSDLRQRWMYDKNMGLFTNQVKGWCLFAGRPDLEGQALKTWGCDEVNPQMIWEFDEIGRSIKSSLGYNDIYNDGKCIKSAGLAGGAVTTADVCNGDLVEQQFDLMSDILADPSSPTKMPKPQPTNLPATSKPTNSPTTQASTGTPTYYPTAPPEPTCTTCDDKETGWQIRKGFDCATDSVRIERKCNKDNKWIAK